MCSLCAWLDSWGASMVCLPFCPAEMTAAPLYLAASGASVGPAGGDPGAPQVTVWGHDLSNQSRERNKAEMRLAASEGRRLHLKWLHAAKVNEIHFLVWMLIVWLNAFNLTERAFFVWEAASEQMKIQENWRKTLTHSEERRWETMAANLKFRHNIFNLKSISFGFKVS